MQVRRTVAPFSWLTSSLLFCDARAACRLIISRCEIALPRPHHQILSCGDIQKHSYLPKSPITLRIAGSVGKQILIPDVRGNAVADRSDLLELLREETLTSRRLGQSPQHSRLLIAIGRVVKADRVDHDVRRLHKLQGFFQLMVAGIVPAIA